MLSVSFVRRPRGDLERRWSGQRAPLSLRQLWIAIAAGALACTIALIALAPSAQANGTATAKIRAFSPNLIGDDGGIPSNPEFPPTYGPVNTPLDTAGDAIDAHEGKVGYFEGRYYWTGTAYRCGYAVFSASSKGFCGFATYTSSDLENWHEEDLFNSPELMELCREGCFQPRVIYSESLHRYLLWFLVFGQGYQVAESETPAGPWTNIHAAQVTPLQPNDFDVFIDHQGRGWIVISVLDLQNRENSALYVERLNADLTSGTGQVALVAKGFREAPAMFQRGSTYYLSVADPACAFCRGATGIYMANDPLGLWRTPASGAGSVPGEPPATIVSSDSCAGQPREVSELPSQQGTIYLLQTDLWTTGPPTPGRRLGDLNQGRAGRYWMPLRFDKNGLVRPYNCESVTEVPLAGGRRANQRSTPISYQQDCRIAANSTLTQSWRYLPETPHVGGRRQLTALEMPMFHARPPEAYLPDGPVTLRLTSGADVLAERSIDAADVSYAAFRQRLPLEHPVKPGTPLSLELSTTATAGCFGVLVRPQRPSDGAGAYVRTLEGNATVAPGARLQFMQIEGRGR